MKTALYKHEFEARQNFDGSVDLFVRHEPIPGGVNLQMTEAVALLRRFAAEQGAVLMVTELPDGSTTKDLVMQDGLIFPYQDPDASVHYADESVNEAQELLYRSLRAAATPEATPLPDPVVQPQRTKQIPGPAEASSPRRLLPPTKMKLTMEDTPAFDVEEDIRRAADARGKPTSGLRAIIVPIAAVAAAAISVIAWWFLSR